MALETQQTATRGRLDGITVEPVISDLQLFSDIFHDNASRSDGPHQKRYCCTETVRVDGMYDYMMFMGESKLFIFKTLHLYSNVKLKLQWWLKVTYPPCGPQLGRCSACQTGCTTSWLQAGSC